MMPRMSKTAATFKTTDTNYMYQLSQKIMQK